MSLTARIRGVLRLLLKRREMEQELSDEVDVYFEMQVDREVARGVSTQEARRLVRLKFENPERVKEKVQDVRSGAGLVSAVRDFKYAFRSIRKNRVFSAVTIITLALGIGATTAIFSVVYAVLLQPLPYRNSDRLVSLFQTGRDDAMQPFLLSDLQILKSHSRSFSDVAAFYKDTGFSRVALTGISEPESVQGGYVSSNFFPLIGMNPSLGRVFTAAEESRSERVVVLSDALWRHRFESAPDVVGRTLEIDGQRFQVIGVMPEAFQLPARDVRFWAPITTNRNWADRPERDTHVRGFYARWNALALLRPGVSLAEAQSEMRLLARRLDESNPDLNRGLGLAAIPLHLEVNGNSRLALWLLFAAVSFLLLISCANAAHLMLAHGASREQELALRLSLGAGPADLLRQLITEALVLSLCAGSAGAPLAMAAVKALTVGAPADVPRLEQTSVNVEVLAFAIGISFLAAIVSGILPAWKFSRTALNDALKHSGRMSRRMSRFGGVRACLVMAEFALTVVLLTAAGLVIRSFLAVQAVDPGFNPEHVLTVRATLPAGTRHRSFYEELLRRIAALPQVRAQGASSGVFEQDIRDPAAQGGPSRTDDGRLRVWADWKSIRADYFQAMGIPLLHGRYFNSRDENSAPLVAILDETMAHRYWPGQDAIGKQFRGHDHRGHDDDPLTVIGIVHDMRGGGREGGLVPHVYQPVAQLGPRDNPDTPDLVIRTAGDPAKIARSLRALIRAEDPKALVSKIETMDEQLDEQVSSRRFQTWLLTVFSLLALFLASVGIYGVMHYLVAQRAHEIGIRLALGAEPARLRMALVREGLTLMTPGLIAGLLGARWLTVLLRGFLFGVKPTDNITYVTVILVLALVTTAAIWAPARRASRIDPLKVLRQE